MTRGSLKLRLLAAGAVSIVFALVIAGFGLLLLFERHVERRVVLELEADLRRLVSGLGRAADGTLQIDIPALDPRYAVPLSGRYWQASVRSDGPALRSRSLWDTVLDLPVDQLADGEVHEHVVPGPMESVLLVVERAVALPDQLGGERVRVAVALDRANIHAAGLAFASDLAPSLVLLAAFLVAAAWVQVAVGLRPLEALRNRLRAVRNGDAMCLGTDFPDEVRPLAAEVDHLLAAQEAVIQRARSRAADLAHGFRTPLTVLAADAEELRGHGETALADEIAGVTDGLRRHVERELAMARAGMRARGGPAHAAGPVIEQVVSVLRRTPAGQQLEWETRSSGVSLRVDPQDLAEMLGNLCENAAKWAVGKVRISALDNQGSLVLRVEDDGPGIPPDQADIVLARGGRLDQSRSGSGLGLAIVRDLAEAYEATLSLTRSDLGGLAAELRFPRQSERLDL